LQAKGYPVYYSEFNGAHVFVCWQGSIADGLLALIGT
jgi:enterochelin esterase-like enzyme